MFKVVDGIDTGKTKKLLAECAKNNGIFVCKHPERIDAKCDAYNIDRVTAVGYNTFFSSDMLFNGRKIYIDELENFLKLEYPSLEGYSLTTE